MRRGVSFSRTKRSISRTLIEKLSSLRVGENKVQDYIVERYESSVEGLITDLRRFGLVNMIALSLMMALVFFRSPLNWKISAFSTVLTGYIAWAAYGYVYQQDWVSAFLFKDWAAPLYQVSMIFVSIILADWLFLKGRITQFIIDAIGNITNLISSAIS